MSSVDPRSRGNRPRRGRPSKGDRGSLRVRVPRNLAVLFLQDATRAGFHSLTRWQRSLPCITPASSVPSSPGSSAVPTRPGLCWAYDGDHLPQDGGIICWDRLVGRVVRHQPYVAVQTLQRLHRGLSGSAPVSLPRHCGRPVGPARHARYPSMHKAGTQLLDHDDREQFLAGIDLILAGIETVNRPAQDIPAR